MMEKRAQYIDVSRGIVILLVVIGHLVSFSGFTWLSIFAFHMPFFFIMSGYCSSESNYNICFKRYLLKYTKAYFIPSMLIRVIYIIVGVSGVDFSQKSWALDCLKYYINPLSEWFIMTLFLSKILFYWIHKIVDFAKDYQVQKVVYIFFIGLSFYLGELWNKNGFHSKPIWFPIPIDCALIALSFLIAGYFIRNFNFEKIYIKCKKQMIWFGTIIFLIIIWMMKYQSYTNVCNMYFGNSSISYYIFACILSVYCLMISQYLLERLHENNLLIRLLRLFGRNTIMVYPGHIILFYYLNKIIFLCTGVQYEPMIHFKTSLIFVYLIITIIIFALICFIKERILAKTSIKNIWIIVRDSAVLIVSCFIIINGLVNFAGDKLGKGNIVEINSLDDFVYFRDRVNCGENFKGYVVKQMIDLDLQSIENFEPIGLFDSGNYFYGTYNGCGHVIKNINIDRNDNCALFPVLGGTVCNLKIESGTISGACVGSFASHATIDGTALIINCINNANICGTVRAGGIADNFNGEIVNCINLGQVNCISGQIGGISSYSALNIVNSMSNINPLYPEIFSFSNNCLRSVIADKFIKEYNFNMGKAERMYKLKLMPIVNGEEGLCFLESSDFFYCIGKVQSFIADYIVDMAMCIAIVFVLIYCRKSNSIRENQIQDQCKESYSS